MQVRILLGAPAISSASIAGRVRSPLQSRQWGIGDNGSTLVLHSSRRGSTPLFSTSPDSDAIRWNVTDAGGTRTAADMRAHLRIYEDNGPRARWEGSGLTNLY